MQNQTDRLHRQVAILYCLKHTLIDWHLCTILNTHLLTFPLTFSHWGATGTILGTVLFSQSKICYIVHWSLIDQVSITEAFRCITCSKENLILSKSMTSIKLLTDVIIINIIML